MKSGWKKRLAYVVIGLGLASGIAGAAVAFRSAIPFGTAASWSAATGGDPNAVRGPWYNTAGHSFNRANGVDYESDTVLSVLAYASCTGGDDTAGLLTAAAAAQALGASRLLIPQNSTCTTSSTISISSAPVVIELGANAILRGTADPLISLTANYSGVVGAGVSSQIQPTSTNGGVYAGHASTAGAPFTLGFVLRNFEVYAPALSAPSYGVYLQDVYSFEVDNVSVLGNSLMTTGYKLEGVEQGEIHGGGLLFNSTTNVDWSQFTTGGTVRFASGNGVNFHGMTLQNGVTNGKNVLYEAQCCDDTEFTENHLTISNGALINIEIDATPNYAGQFVIAHNHIESISTGPNALTNAANAWNIKTSGAYNVAVLANQLDEAPNPFNTVLITGSSQNVKLTQNRFAGIVEVDSGSTNNLIADNDCTGSVTLTDSGTDTLVQTNRGQCNLQDTTYASAFTVTDIMQFYPKGNGSGGAAGSNWGIVVYGSQTAANWIYDRQCAYKSSTDCAGWGKQVGTDAIIFRKDPTNTGETAWATILPGGINTALIARNSQSAAAVDTAGSSFTVNSQTGGTASVVGGGAGGLLSIQANIGGAGTGGLAAGVGGGLNLQSGNGGANNGGGGALGGGLNITAGQGSNASGSSAGSQGGQILVTAGKGGAGAAGAAPGGGNQIVTQGGTGGASAGTGVGGTGGDSITRGGVGGAGSGALAGGTGGGGFVQGWIGGASTATGIAGAGGPAQLAGGAAGANNGGGGNNGGTATVRGGLATGAGTNGSVNIGDINTNNVNVADNASDKLGFFAVTAVVQQNGTGNTTTVAAGSTTSVFTNTTFSGGVGSTGYTVGDIVKAMKNYGLLAQ